MAAATDQLHAHAMEAEKHLEQLATGIASVGADDNTVKAITQMADMCRQIAAKLAQGMKEEPPPARPTADEAIAAHMAQRRQAAAAPPA